MKIKRTTYGEFNRRFSGFKRFGCIREEMNLETSGLMPIKYRAIALYRKSKDYTIIALSCLGYLDLFGPHDSDLTYVLKMDGHTTLEDLIDKEFKYHDDVKMITEELYNKWHDELQEYKEAEEES